MEGDPDTFLSVQRLTQSMFFLPRIPYFLLPPFFPSPLPSPSSPFSFPFFPSPPLFPSPLPFFLSPTSLFPLPYFPFPSSLLPFHSSLLTPLSPLPPLPLHFFISTVPSDSPLDFVTPSLYALLADSAEWSALSHPIPARFPPFLPVFSHPFPLLLPVLSLPLLPLPLRPGRRCLQFDPNFSIGHTHS